MNTVVEQIGVFCFFLFNVLPSSNSNFNRKKILRGEKYKFIYLG